MPAVWSQACPNTEWSGHKLPKHGMLKAIPCLPLTGALLVHQMKREGEEEGTGRASQWGVVSSFAGQGRALAADTPSL